MSNPVGVSKWKDVAFECNCVVSDDGDIIATVSNSIVPDEGKCVAMDVNALLK